jgi:hypothetical protein
LTERGERLEEFHARMAKSYGASVERVRDLDYALRGLRDLGGRDEASASVKVLSLCRALMRFERGVPTTAPPGFGAKTPADEAVKPPSPGSRSLEKITCTDCGTVVADEDQFCRHCGEPFEE